MFENQINAQFHGTTFSIVNPHWLHFRFLTGDVNYTTYGGSWVSRQFHNGDFAYRLVIQLINMHEATGDENQPQYHVGVYAVSPEAAGQDNVDRAFDGLPEEFRDKELFQVEALHSYGIQATLWRASGDNWDKLMRAARRQCLFINSFFGFYMDVPENRIGNTGWDFIAGDIGFK